MIDTDKEIAGLRRFLKRRNIGRDSRELALARIECLEVVKGTRGMTPKESERWIAVRTVRKLIQIHGIKPEEIL